MQRVLIIAEAGVNHNGKPELAFKLVDEAKSAGADMIKFQVFKADMLVCPHAPKAAYQYGATARKESQRDMLRSFELSRDTFRELANYCVSRGIGFLATPFDFSSINMLSEMQVPIFKVPSGEIINLPYLRNLGSLKKEVLLSTGMSTLEEISAALRILESSGTKRSNVTILHCTTEYPAPLAEVNLHAICTIHAAFPGIKGVGYSDHTSGVVASIAAVALGAVVIEKHFTLDKNMEGPDHKASITPSEFSEMVRAIRDVELALGDGEKRPSASEIKNIYIVRKSIVTTCAISKGEIFSEQNLTTKRPGTGLSPLFWDFVIGSRAIRSYEQDEVLEADYALEYS